VFDVESHTAPGTIQEFAARTRWALLMVARRRSWESDSMISDIEDAVDDE